MGIGTQKQAVSVVIPTHNRAHLITRAINSARASLEKGDELLVVDDGSSDDTVAVVERLGPPVRLLRLPHRGAGAARNSGFAASRGPLVAFLDSDDEWFPDKVRLQRAFFERRPDVVYACSDFGVRLEDGGELRRCLPRWLSTTRPLSEVFGPGELYSSTAPLPPGREDFDVYVGDRYLEEMRNNFISAFTLMVRKHAVEGLLEFAEDLPTCEEMPAFGRLTRCGPGALFDTETAWQHGHSGGRLTQLPMEVWAQAWLSSLERVWGDDPQFLASHARDYRRVTNEARLMRSVYLARGGDLRELGRAVRLAAGDPLAFRNLIRRSGARRGGWGRRTPLQQARPQSGKGHSPEDGR